MKAKIYTDGVDYIGGFKKPSKQTHGNMWVHSSIVLTQAQFAHLNKYGHVEIPFKNTTITFFAKNY